MRYVMHKATQAVRRITGERGDILHFAQVIKENGRTFFWALRSECDDLGPNPTGFDVSIAALMNRIKQRKLREKAGE